MVGEQIGNFRITSLLGKGGMGEVYLGEHGAIGTRVAIKMLQEQISTAREQVERFFNEAIAVSKIQHSGIGKIFDVGSYKGRAYLVMEFLAGETLATRIRRLGKLPLAHVCELGRQICGVLEAVHKAGITHRDLKPDNIFIVPDEELPCGERVKILDFGIAKLSTAGGGLTTTGSGSMGTPAYMSPEQWKNSKNVDWRADAYSLGCLTFEMVAGRPPFIAQTIGEACSLHLTEEPPRLASLVAAPPQLDALVASLLAKSPDHRPATMRDIANTFVAIPTNAPMQMQGAAMALGPTLPSTPPASPYRGTQVTGMPMQASTMQAPPGMSPMHGPPSMPMPPTVPAPPGMMPMVHAPTMPAPTGATSMSNTTLGGAASSRDVPAAPKKNGGALRWIVIGGLAAAAIVGVILIASSGGSPGNQVATRESPPTPPAPTTVIVEPQPKVASVSEPKPEPKVEAPKPEAPKPEAPKPEAPKPNAPAPRINAPNANLNAPNRAVRRVEGRSAPEVGSGSNTVFDDGGVTLPKQTPDVVPTVRSLLPQLNKCNATHGDGRSLFVGYVLRITPEGKLTGADLTFTTTTTPSRSVDNLALNKCLTAVLKTASFKRSQIGTSNQNGFRVD